MYITVLPGSSLEGVVGSGDCPPIPGDKSLSHRAALFSAIAEGESRVENFQVSGVTKVMLEAIGSLGVDWELNKSVLSIKGKGLDGFLSPNKPINCGNSATTLRLLTGGLAAAGIEAILDGSEGLRKRPMKRIVEPLQMMNVPIKASPDGTAPLKLEAREKGNKLKSLNYTLPVASAQVKSCLLLAGLSADGQVILREPDFSRDHTERMLSYMGVDVASSNLVIEGEVFFETRLSPLSGKGLRPLNLSLPGDFSAAAFLIVAALITPGSKIFIPDVGLNPTRTGLLDALIQMGGNIEISGQNDRAGEPLGNLTVTASKLFGIEVSGGLVVRMIDEFPAFAIAAAYAKGKTIVKDATELRYKESDRIGRLVAELVNLGVDITETGDGFIINGGKPLKGGSSNPYGDHRLAMSLMVAGLGASSPIQVAGSEVMTESFPEFSKVLANLGANLESNV